MAICVGQIVCTPCSAYQAARRGSSTRAITFSNVEAALRDLRHDQVRVIAVG